MGGHWIERLSWWVRPLQSMEKGECVYQKLGGSLKCESSKSERPFKLVAGSRSRGKSRKRDNGAHTINFAVHRQHFPKILG